MELLRAQLCRGHVSAREVDEESLEDCLYSTDIGGEQWLAERHPEALDANGVLQQGNLVPPNGGS